MVIILIILLLDRGKKEKEDPYISEHLIESATSFLYKTVTLLISKSAGDSASIGDG